jgi:hypothetical protein
MIKGLAVNQVYLATGFTGKIDAVESIFRHSGQLSRPFSYSAGLTARCCSMPLQLVIADFGADHAFAQVPTKLQEHFGIQIPVSTIRKITELHGQQMHEQREALALAIGFILMPKMLI